MSRFLESYSEANQREDISCRSVGSDDDFHTSLAIRQELDRTRQLPRSLSALERGYLYSRFGTSIRIAIPLLLNEKRFQSQLTELGCKAAGVTFQ